jgi:hypothetical protein
MYTLAWSHSTPKGCVSRYAHYAMQSTAKHRMHHHTRPLTVPRKHSMHHHTRPLTVPRKHSMHHHTCPLTCSAVKEPEPEAEFTMADAKDEEEPRYSGFMTLDTFLGQSSVFEP